MVVHRKSKESGFLLSCENIADNALKKRSDLTWLPTILARHALRCLTFADELVDLHQKGHAFHHVVLTSIRLTLNLAVKSYIACHIHPELPEVRSPRTLALRLSDKRISLRGFESGFTAYQCISDAYSAISPRIHDPRTFLVRSLKRSKELGVGCISEFHTEDQTKVLTPDTLSFRTQFSRPLWTDTRGRFEDNAELFLPGSYVFDQKSPWHFWHEWHQGFLGGSPMDWELQRRVALIDDAIWEAGPEAVAKEIERIKEDFATTNSEVQDRFPEHEPKSVAHLIENRVIASASLQGLSVQIADAIEQYHAETGANALPDAFTPLSEMPSLLEAIASSLKSVPDTGQASSDLVQHLREENGRLNAKISELEKELQKLRLLDPKLATRSELGNLFSFLKKTSLIGGIVSGLWVLSGDDLGAKQRYERLIADWEFTKDLVQGEVSPAQGLPTTQVGTSLRPVARPKNN